MTKQHWKKTWSKARFFVRYDALFSCCEDVLAVQLLLKRNQPDPLLQPNKYEVYHHADIPL